MKVMKCFKVRLQRVSDGCNDRGIVGRSYGHLDEDQFATESDYIETEDGFVYVSASDVSEVGTAFPAALSIELVGVGVEVSEV